MINSSVCDVKPYSSCLMHINIRSVVNKLDELIGYLDLLEDKVDILGVTEHWLQSGNSDVLNRLNDYNILSFYGRSDSIRGGVFLAVRKQIPSKARPDLERFSLEKVMECAAVEVNSNVYPRPLVVVAIYHPPSANTNLFLEQFELILNSLSREICRKDIVICGDLNIDSLCDTPVD